MSELNAADRWIYGALAADTALVAVVGARIYVDLAPQTTPPTATPYVVFQYQGGADLMVIGGARVWTNAVYLIRGIDETLTYDGDSKTIADRIDAALHRGSGTNASGVVYAAVRESPFRLTETADGKQFRHLGGLYRIYAKGA